MGGERGKGGYFHLSHGENEGPVAVRRWEDEGVRWKSLLRRIPSLSHCFAMGPSLSRPSAGEG